MLSLAAWLQAQLLLGFLGHYKTTFSDMLLILASVPSVLPTELLCSKKDMPR